MASVGVRELKEHTSEIVRRVRDDGETIDITYRGEVVATIQPKRPFDPDHVQEFWDRVDKLRRDIAAQIGPEPIDAVELVREQRRNLTPDEWVPPDYRGEM
jgi:prevent-host-death family protein